METNNNFFYIFLNIKGALYTADWVKFIQSANLQNEPEYKASLEKLLITHKDWTKFYNQQAYLKPKHIRKICPYNVMALNRLIDDLKLDYDINLVITSDKWKESFDLKTIPALVKNGLNYSGIVLDKTDNYISDTKEGIFKYLRQVGNPTNFLVIDYQDCVLSGFDESNTLKVDQYKNGLTDEIVDNFLDSRCDEEFIENETEQGLFDDFELAQI